MANRLKLDTEKYEEYWQKAVVESVPKPKDEQKLEIPKVSEGEVQEVTKKKAVSFFQRLRSRRNPTKSYLIRMEYSNGTCRQFIIISNKETFTLGKRMYYLRYEDAVYNLSLKEYELRFNEDYPTPITREIMLLEDPDEPDKKLSKALFTISPSVLKNLIRMEFIDHLANASQIDRFLKMALILGIFTLLIVIVLAYYVLKGAGVF